MTSYGSYTLEGTNGSLLTSGTSPGQVESNDGTSNNVRYSSTWKRAGSTSALLAGGSSSSAKGLIVGTGSPGSPATTYFRGYYNLSALPSTGYNLMLAARDYFGALEGLYVKPNGSFAYAYEGADASNILSGMSSAGLVSAGTPFRIEIQVASSGGIVKLFSGASVDSESETTYATFTGNYSYGAYVVIGNCYTSAGVAATPTTAGRSMYVDAVELQDTTWVGPISSAVTRKGWGVVK